MIPLRGQMRRDHGEHEAEAMIKKGASRITD